MMIRFTRLHDLNLMREALAEKWTIIAEKLSNLDIM